MSTSVSGGSRAAPAFMVSKFPTAMPAAEQALGVMDPMTWLGLKDLLGKRREGGKDGPNIVLARFAPEPNGAVHRLKEKVLARTAIALDCETDKKTGEVPPPVQEVVARLEAKGWTAALYTSHSHTDAAPRYRIVLPLTAEIPHELPAVEVIAHELELDGVLDRGKIGAASVFYLPSCVPGQQSNHQTVAIDGLPIDAAWMTKNANRLLAEREAIQAERRAAVMVEAEKRRAARLKSGKKDSENLIASIRDHLDLEGELMKHGYAKRSGKFLYPGSESGIPGVHIMAGNDGVERVYSHHSGDPLAEGNLPAWCFTKAVDAVDVVAILEFGGNQKKALHELATRFGIGQPLKAKMVPDEPPGFGDVPPPQDIPEDRCSGSFDAVDSRVGDDNGLEADQQSNRCGEQLRWQLVNPCDLQDAIVPERVWIVQDWIPAEVVTSNYADGGVGKTLLALQLQIAAWLQKPWCGLAVKPCRSIGLYCEDDTDELHRRADRVLRHHGADFRDLEGVQWISGVGCDNILAEPLDGRMKPTSQLIGFEKAIEQHRATLAILDTAADLFGGDEVKRAQVRGFIGLLNAIALRRGCAILLNAHPSKSGQQTGGDMDSGSTAWNASVRSRLSLTRPDGEARDTPDRVLTRRKSNYAAAGEEIRLQWANGVFAPVHSGGTLDAMVRQQDQDMAFLRLLDRVERDGRPVSDNSRAGNYAPKLFASMPDNGQMKARDLASAMERLFAEGRIKLADYGRTGGSGARPRKIVPASVQGG